MTGLIRKNRGGHWAVSWAELLTVLWALLLRSFRIARAGRLPTGGPQHAACAPRVAVSFGWSSCVNRALQNGSEPAYPETSIATLQAYAWGGSGPRGSANCRDSTPNANRVLQPFAPASTPPVYSERQRNGKPWPLPYMRQGVSQVIPNPKCRPSVSRFVEDQL